MRNTQTFSLNAKYTFLLYLQDWGKPGDLRNLNIQWHVPSAEEIAFSFYLLDSFLQPELDKLARYADADIEMTRSVVA